MIRPALFLCSLLVAGVTFAQRPLGIDVSHWQGSINWNSVATSGVTFAWCKATEHTSYSDPTYVFNQTNAANNGVKLGPYHFARPDLDPGIAGAIAESVNFWNVISNYVKGSNTYMMPMLDVETRGATNATPDLTAATLSQWVNAFCSNLVALAAAKGVAIKPVIYSGGYFSSTMLNTTITNWTPWIANWPASPDPQVDSPSGTAPWPMWTFWQYSSTGVVPGISGDVDLDVFNGTSNTLSLYAVGTPLAPFFLSQPYTHRVADTGGTVILASGAGGTLPLKYQWTSNSVAIVGATNAVLTLANVQTNQSATYAVMVTNSLGSITSSPVTVRVYPLQAVVYSDNFDANSAANWILNRSSADHQVTFAFDYSTLGIPSAPNSGGTTKGLQMKVNLASNAVAAVSLSPTNQSFTGDYRLRFNAWINVNGPFPAGGGGSTESLTAGIGTIGTNTLWTGAGSKADGGWFMFNGEGGASSGSATPDFGAFSNTTLMATGSGVYAAGTDSLVRDDSHLYYLRAFPQARTAPAFQQTNYPQQGSNALDPSTLGLAWRDVIVSKRGGVIDWAVDGIRLATISNVTFAANNVTVGFWDPFSSLSSNNAINFGLVDNVRVEQPAVAPNIAAHPQSLWAYLGSNATFTVAATGLPAPAYQWRFNGTNLAGATNAALLLANVQGTNAGLYSVVVTNIAGSQTSSNALLSLIASTQPTVQFAGPPGSSVQLDCLGQLGATYALETSTNLVTWTTLTNLVAPTASFSINQPISPADSQRYYRLRSGP